LGGTLVRARVPILVAGVGFLVAGAFDSIFNGADLAGYLLTVAGLLGFVRFDA
jgi:hypothetical protein